MPKYFKKFVLPAEGGSVVVGRIKEILVSIDGRGSSYLSMPLVCACNFVTIVLAITKFTLPCYITDV